MAVAGLVEHSRIVGYVSFLFLPVPPSVLSGSNPLTSLTGLNVHEVGGVAPVRNWVVGVPSAEESKVIENFSTGQEGEQPSGLRLAVTATDQMAVIAGPNEFPVP